MSVSCECTARAGIETAVWQRISCALNHFGKKLKKENHGAYCNRITLQCVSSIVFQVMIGNFPPVLEFSTGCGIFHGTFSTHQDS